MRPTPLVMIAFLACVSCPALAASKAVFSCDTSKGKTITVTQANDAVHYAFGKHGLAPELEISVPVASFDYRHSIGMEMEDHYLNFVNGSTTYSIDVVTMAEEGREASLTVTKDGKDLAVIQCKDKSIRFEPSAIGKAPASDL